MHCLDVSNVLQHATASGLFLTINAEVGDPDGSHPAHFGASLFAFLVSDSGAHELMWANEYKKRKTAAKDALSRSVSLWWGFRISLDFIPNF